MRWLLAVMMAIVAGTAHAADGWVVGDLVGAAVIGSDGRAVARIGDLYADRSGRVWLVRLDAQGGSALAPWPSLHPDPRGQVVRLAGGIRDGQAVPSGLVSLRGALGSPVRLAGGAVYGWVATVRIGRDGLIEAVLVKPAAPAVQFYRLGWAALDFDSLPQVAAGG